MNRAKRRRQFHHIEIPAEDIEWRPKQTKPYTLNRHHIAIAICGGREFNLHATKGWRSRRLEA